MINIETIKCYQTNIVLFDDSGNSFLIDWDGQQLQFTEDEWADYLFDLDYSAESVDVIIEYLNIHNVIKPLN